VSFAAYEKWALLETIRGNSATIENLTSAVAILTESLKNTSEKSFDFVEPQPSQEYDCDMSPEILPPRKVCAPEFGSRVNDKSVNMHIYDTEFKPDKSDGWSLEPILSGGISPEDKRTSLADELNGLFNDCRQSANMIVKPGGGYATINDISSKSSVNDRPKQCTRRSKKVSGNNLSRADELDIINSFSHLRGMEYSNAVQLAQENGYSLHAVYVNDLPRNPNEKYSKTVIGVKVKDPNYAPNGIFSENAVIVNITDVGGQDIHNRG
jgi:hypothetical protein